ncbi:MAG: VWA domain-containing protein [Bradyrhizobium sp.]
MAGEPTKPNSSAEISPAQKSHARQNAPLPEARPSAAEDIAAFVAKARAMSPHREGAKGRLVFALDATMSRQPTWDMACALQADMFREAASIGSLDIRLVYYRGLNECRATGWISDSAQLARLMSKIDCQGGNTQIGKVLSEARREAVASAVRAVVFVGDAMEEAVDDLCAKAGELGLLKVPVFMFQEGHDVVAEQAFREIARLTGGAWCRFDPGAAAQLRELLRAVAAYAAGGREALLRLAKTGSGAAKLIGQMK